MLRNVLVGLGLLILVVFAFVGYNSYSAKQHTPSDDVYTAAGQTIHTTPTADPAPAQAAPTGATTTGQLTANGATTAQGITPPASDSIAPDPPNGEKFGGGGSKYQLYRQGDLTWRLNTETGETCIIFATDEEWHKPVVYQNGCRGRS